MAFLFVIFTFSASSRSAILYKSYVVEYDRGWDILCDPYVVQKGDWVYKIFRQKGEISSRDFQEFLAIFKRLNPQIHDIDRIRPHQNILIPIKKIEPNAFPDQSKGIVTVPFVTISKMAEILNPHVVSYHVKKGDYLSRLISERFGAYGTKSYLEGIELFKIVNPDINNLNDIAIGQRLLLPNPAIQNEPWYRSLFDSRGNLRKSLRSRPAEESAAAVAIIPNPIHTDADPLSRAAAILDARLLKKGTYFFPRAGQDDVELDLVRFPVIETKDGSRIIFVDKADSMRPDFDFLKSFWKKSTIVEVEAHTPIDEILESIFKDTAKQLLGNTLVFKVEGLEITVKAQWIQTNPSKTDDSLAYICITLIENDRQRTSGPIVRYLDQHGIRIEEVMKGAGEASAKKKADQKTAAPFMLPNVTTIAPTGLKTFVFDLLDALGCSYQQNVSITFPYAGIHVQAVSTLVSTGKGRDFLIDFGELYGDAVQEIKKTGIGAIQLKEDEDANQIIEKILSELGGAYVANPTFSASKRTSYNTELKIYGYLLSPGDGADILISGAPLHNRVLQFLNEAGVKVILTGLFNA
jgi:hypothetical protein